MWYAAHRRGRVHSATNTTGLEQRYTAQHHWKRAYKYRFATFTLFKVLLIYFLLMIYYSLKVKL